MSTLLIPTRWRLFSILFLLSFLSYLMRQNIHVAGEFMMPELGISEIEMGWIYAAFIWGYALCQLPGGILGKRLGPRLALTSIGLVWVITTALTGWLPGHIFTTGSGIIASLLIVRFLVGVAHAPIYPIQAAVVERWFPVGHWALPNAVSSTGLTLGAAVAQPLVAVVMVYWGWRVSFYLFIPLGLVLFLLWWWYATDEPADHPSMTAVELAHIQKSRQQLTQDVGFGAWKQLIKNRDTLLLTCAYFAENYIFYLFFTWFFHYLVTELGFSILETGFLASLPWLSGAVMASIGGYTCDALCARLGPPPGVSHPCDHRPRQRGHLSLCRSLRQLPLHSRLTLVALFRQHTIYRRVLLVGANVYRRTLHCAGVWRDEYRGKPRRHRGCTLNAVSCGAHWLGRCSVNWNSRRFCGRYFVAVYPRRPAVQASASRLIIDRSEVQVLRSRPMHTEAERTSFSIGSPSSSLSKTSSYLHCMTDQSALLLTLRRTESITVEEHLSR